MLRRVTLLLLAVVGLSLTGTPRISFIRPPAFLAEGYKQTFRLRMPQSDDNRHLELVAYDDGLDVLRSGRDVDGHSAPLQTFDLILPRGHLKLTARLFGVQGVILGLASTPIWVRGQFEEPEDEP